MAKLTESVALRLSEDVYNRLLGEATLQGVSLGQHIRQRLGEVVAAPVQPTVSLENIERAAAAAAQIKKAKKIKSSDEKQRLIYLFNKTSNNVNQLAHRANLDYNTGTISEATYSNILNQLELMARYMKAVIKDVD
ncbi:hypothetical protein [Thiopseudomonas alkaliphila]|uniref:hypothetical protein n=1 Tax=Thiopseudomonas alkaliphila TaxID=1697053 RepID=UPI0025774C5A|nr:hypothetical protein [Thiopseudomonas alkaliphila]MDM1708935.1 plasmid mobilization relaxosome protein MobC [Thiopseudomonas alkaliphila]